MKWKRSFLLLTLSCLGVLSYAQQPLSLKEAIDYSLKNHGSNAVYANQLEIAKEQAKEALAAYLPQVNASVLWDDNLKRQTTVIPAGVFSPTDVKVQFGNKYNTNALVQLDQTIYDQSLLYGLKANGPSQKIAEIGKSKNEEDLVYNTASAYARILILKEQQKLLEASERQYKDLYGIIKFRFEKGVAKKVDLDKITVNLNNVVAQKKLVQTGIEVAYNTLKNAMGLPLETNIAITDSLEYGSYLQIPVENVNVTNRLDYQLQQQHIALQQIDVKRKQAAYLPTVSAYARYGNMSFNNELSKSVSNWVDYSTVGLKVNVPIFSGRKRESQLRQSRLELDNANQNLKLQAQALQLEFQNANRQLQETITNLAANKDNMELAAGVYETSRFEYQKGVSSMSDLLNADFAFQQAKSNYVTSLLNLIGTRLSYEKAKGTIKDFIQHL